jgi:hypothetical protein
MKSFFRKKNNNNFPENIFQCLTRTKKNHQRQKSPSIRFRRWWPESGQFRQIPISITGLAHWLDSSNQIPKKIRDLQREI